MSVTKPSMRTRSPYLRLSSASSRFFSCLLRPQTMVSVTSVFVISASA